MPRCKTPVLALCLASSTGCVLDVLLPGTRDELPPAEQPVRDEWRTAIAATLAPDVAQLQIGGRELDENFANRGDIDVRFDGAEGEIVVEMRRFAFAVDDVDAEEILERLHPWAYAGEPVGPPGPSMADHACDDTWVDGCQLRVWYEGQIQPHLSGADLRVILPPTFRGPVVLRTEDLVDDQDYPARGDVTIAGLPGSAEIEVERGRVEVALAAEALPAPVCGEAANASCAAFVGPDGPAPWDPDCGCLEFGHLSVDGIAADVTVDLPPSLWANVALENAHADGPVPRCDVALACEEFEACDITQFDPGKPDRLHAELVDPGASALEGAGYHVQVTSDACQAVSFVDGPDDYHAAELERRGDLAVCSGCLAATP